MPLSRWSKDRGNAVPHRQPRVKKMTQSSIGARSAKLANSQPNRLRVAGASVFSRHRKKGTTYMAINM